MLQADAKGKFLGIGYQPGKSATLVRNPNWHVGNGDPRPAYLDKININIGGDTNVIGRQVLTGTHVLQNDTPAGSIVKLAYQKYYNQLVAVPGAGDFYVALNNKQGPFSNVNVRKALWAALDREAMVKEGGGEVVGQVGTHFIYPGSAGYDLAGGDHGPNVDYNNYPAGNLAVAAKYMKLAGYPSGKYTGSATVKVVGSTGDPADKYGSDRQPRGPGAGVQDELHARRPVGHVPEVLRRPQGRDRRVPRTWAGSAIGRTRRRCSTRRSPVTTT